MGKIVTAREAMADWLEHKKRAVQAHHAFQSVRAVHGILNGRRTSIASCILIKRRSRFYLVTAAHVTDHLTAMNPLFIFTESSAIQLVGGFFATKPPNGIRNADMFDFSVMPLMDEIVGQIGRSNFISGRDNAPFTQYSQDHLMIALGYPIPQSRVYGNPHGLLHIRMPCLLYTGNLEKNPDIFKAIDVDWRDHLLLHYEKFGEDSEGRYSRLPKPRGMSGGAVFCVENRITPEDVARPAPASIKLVGIITEYHPRHSIIVAIGLSKVIESIDRITSGLWGPP